MSLAASFFPVGSSSSLSVPPVLTTSGHMIHLRRLGSLEALLNDIR